MAENNAPQIGTWQGFVFLKLASVGAMIVALLGFFVGRSKKSNGFPAYPDWVWSWAGFLFWVFLGLFLLFLLLGATLKATPSGWLGAVYRFEKYVRQIGPGLKSVNPFTEKVRLYSSQQIEINPQPQTVTTKDSFTITLNSVAYVQLWDLEILITRFGGKMFKKLKESMAGKNEAKEDETEGDGIINQMIGFFESETRVYGGSRNVELLKAGAVDETWRDGIDKELKRVFGFTLIKFAFTDAPLAENVTKAMNDLLAAKTMAEKLKVESTAAAEKMGIDADANAARVEKEATAEANAIKTVMLAYKANGIEGAQFVAMKIAKEFGPNSKLILGLGNAFKELGLGSIFEKIIK